MKTTTGPTDGSGKDAERGATAIVHPRFLADSCVMTGRRDVHSCRVRTNGSSSPSPNVRTSGSARRTGRSGDAGRRDARRRDGRGGSCANCRRATPPRARRGSCCGPVANGRFPNTWHSEFTLQVTWCSAAMRRTPAHTSADSAPASVPETTQPSANGAANEMTASSGKRRFTATRSRSRSRSGANRRVGVASGVNSQPQCAWNSPRS